MTSKDSYGDLNEITVDNTRFILNVTNGVAQVDVYVIDENSNDVIGQNVSIGEIKHDDGTYCEYITPPLDDPEIDIVDPEVLKLA